MARFELLLHFFDIYYFATRERKPVDACNVRHEVFIYRDNTR